MHLAIAVRRAQPLELLADLRLQLGIAGRDAEPAGVLRIAAPEQQPNLIARKLAGHQHHIVASPAYLGGPGLALLPDWLIQQDLEAGALAPVLADYRANPGEMAVGIYAVYPANRRGASKIRVFTDLLAAALE
ncbi:LysR substrate-binding domain-containing protein [Duganella lactea]|nr:LysR substrate-binding domain-containing protein [Duganella lactea]